LKLEFLSPMECNPSVGGTTCGDKAISAAQRGDKVAILRQVLLEGQAVSMVCEEHDVSPTLFYTWQKHFFENGAAAFAKEASAEQRDLERQVDALRQRLGQKDRVIAKVTEEFVKLKKGFFRVWSG
jgi:transposase-like protein